MAKQKEKIKKVPQRKKRIYRRRQTSIYFLLWAVFSALALLIVLLFGITQQVMLTRMYRQEAHKELQEKGSAIERTVINPPAQFGGNKSALLRYLAAYYDVQAVILDESGNVLFPQEPEIAPAPEEEVPAIDFSDEIKRLLSELNKRGDRVALYEGDGEYVYGSSISLYEDSKVYLYVSTSLDLMDSVRHETSVRMVLVAVFVFILCFAIASAVAGWITKPITEMSEKARKLARGDFGVDFHDRDYSEEMLGLADALNFARDELSKTDTMQKELIANVSHDFKTPLTMIKAYASMIKEISGDIPEKREKHAQVIVDEADRLASLVADILDLSKIRSGINVMQLTEIDMSAYVEEILRRFDYLKETQGYVFEVDVEEGLYTRADEVKIGQALYNLIGNAINYTGEDKRVAISLKKTGENVFRFAVKDTGAGIKSEELATIWERYYRSSEMHKRPVKGTGLGLSIVKTVLEKHGFLFGVESREGEGSVFYVDFPLLDEPSNV